MVTLRETVIEGQVYGILGQPPPLFPVPAQLIVGDRCVVAGQKLDRFSFEQLERVVCIELIGVDHGLLGNNVIEDADHISWQRMLPAPAEAGQSPAAFPFFQLLSSLFSNSLESVRLI